MEYPLIDKQLLSWLRLMHGAFNSAVMLLFFYQGWLGITIRRARESRGPLPFSVIKRHRTLGPVLAVLAGLGFLAGLTLVLLNTGNVLEYPPHFSAGLVLVVLIIAAYKISRNIKGPDSPYRTPHFILGIAVLCLYLVQVFLGIGVLL
jgi:hypothetical protein